MGESSPCLVPPLSGSSPSSGEEERKINPLQRALTTSVSFGRFTSESLDWEKWSVFTHNRYMEEVERYSKPGTVAEKKAYFEAHYKRRRAAALLGLEDAAAATSLSETNVTDQVENSSYQDAGNVEIHSLDQETKVDELQIRLTEFPLPGSSSTTVDEEEVETEHRDGEDVVKPSLILENSAIRGNIMSGQDRIHNKDASPSKSSASSRKKRSNISSTKTDCASKFLELRIPVQSRDRSGIPEGKNTSSNHKGRPTAASHHMSIDFASCAGEMRKGRFQGLMKMSAPKLVKTPVNTSKNNTSLQISSKAIVNGTFKQQHSLSSQTEKRKQNCLDSVEVCGSNSKFPTSTIGNKVTVSSSYFFKSEERVAKRKEKLEQKFQSKESDELQVLAAKSQVKSRQNFKDLPNPTTLKATANNSRLMSCSPKFQERAAFKVQDNDSSRSPWRFSVNVESSKNLSSRPPVCSANYKKSMRENIPPNINNQL